ncbi:MAG TPA: FimV/HubP family polar landmark protein [Burkholderiales bacterium]
MLAAALWLVAPLAAHSAGLGRISVLSSLGRPLNAEIELHTQPGEQDLVARLASPEAFSRAGIEINPALLSVRFTVERRNGRQVLRVTTTQPVNEPFLDLLVDLQWNGGRLLREYTVLLDPPEFKGRQAIAATPAPKPAPQPQPAAPVDSKPAPGVEAKPLPPEPAPPILAPTPPSAAITPQETTEAEKPASEKPEAEKPTAEKPAAAPAAAAAGTHEVQKGDTLGTIARQNLPPGVSLNQMLVAIYRANEGAFIRGNVNLMRAGRILEIPDAGSIGTVDRDDASRLVSEHHAQFNEYRSRLAAVPAPAEAAADQRDDAGRIEPKPEAAAAPAPAQDQVRLSKADPKKPATPGGRAAREDDQVARERELREAQSRVADLEKNVSDLQRLLEMKNQQLAELEKKAGAQAAPPSAAPVPPAAKPAAEASDTPVAKVPEAPSPVPAPPLAAAPTAETSEAPKPPPPPAPVAEAPKPAPPSPVAEAQPTPPPVAKGPATPAAQTPKPKPKPAAAPRPEPSFFEDPMLLSGLAVVLLGLVGYSAFLWRRRKAAQAKFQDSVLGAAVAGAVAGSAGEPGAPTMQPRASHAPVSRAGMEAEEVDPIAEADVYIAYGRDAQAEQILKEALAKDANRKALHTKLLEIYANRKDAKAFEQTALKLKNLTNGAGLEWDKACALGRGIDPRNGLYGSGGEARPTAVTAPTTAAAAPTLDFDLGGPSQNPAAVPDISLDETGKRLSSLSGIDIDLGTTVPAAAPAAHEKTVTSIDFNLDLGTTKGEAPSGPEPAAAQPSGGLDFDLKLDDMPSAAPEEKSAPPVDLGSISLDLGTPSDATMVAPQRSTDPKWQEVATKLDLAKAYEEMGDRNGARELLNEVMKDGDAAQKGQAGQLLAKLS